MLWETWSLSSREEQRGLRTRYWKYFGCKNEKQDKNIMRSI
jgi:hypothetical protein